MAYKVLHVQRLKSRASSLQHYMLRKPCTTCIVISCACLPGKTPHTRPV